MEITNHIIIDFTYSDDSGCPNNITRIPTSDLTTASMIKSSDKLTIATVTNYILPRDSSKDTLTGTANTINTPVSSQTPSLNITIDTSSISTKTSSKLPVTYSKQDHIVASTIGSCTSMTETIPITATSLSDNVTSIASDSTIEISLSSLGSLTKTSDLSTLQPSIRSSTKHTTANVSGSCTSMPKTTQSVTETITKPIAKSTIEMTSITNQPTITKIINTTKNIFTFMKTSVYAQSCTRNMPTTSSLFLSSTIKPKNNSATAITTKKINDSVPTDNDIQSTTINRVTINASEKQTTRSSHDKSTITLINNETKNRTITKELMSISVDITSQIYNLSTEKNEISGTSNRISVTTKDSTITLVECKTYSKNCNRPVTWETTEKGETRDFYQILKARFGNKVHLLRHTTHWPKRMLRYNDETESFLFGRHNDIRY